MSVSINRPRQERPRVNMMIDGRSVSRRQSRSRGDARPKHRTRSSFSFPSPNNLQQPTFNTMTTQTTMMKKAIMEATTTMRTTIRSSSSSRQQYYRHIHSQPALLRLNDVLTTPSAVASALDWKKLNGSVLTLNIHSNRISAAVATHPSSMISSTTTPPPLSSARSLPDIPLGRRATVTDDTRQRLQDSITRIMREDNHPICGVIVAWPIQPDTGRMGAACGRVLHTLDQLLLPINPTTTTSDSNANANDTQQDLATTASTTTTPSSFVSTAHDHQQRRRRKQPLWCLWDAGDHSTTPPPPDEWGRSSAFAGLPLSSSSTTTPTIHRASLEQYSTDEAMTAMEVWDHFCQAHWPELRAAEVVAPQSSSYQGQRQHQHLQQHQLHQQWNSSGTTSSTTILKKKKKTLSNHTTLSNGRGEELRQWAASIHPQQGSIAAHHHS
jgi:hypothetical protein